MESALLNALIVFCVNKLVLAKAAKVDPLVNKYWEGTI